MKPAGEESTSRTNPTDTDAPDFLTVDCQLCGFFIDMVQETLIMQAPNTPPIPRGKAGQFIEVSPEAGFLPLCQVCSELLKAYLQIKAAEVRAQDPVKSRIHLPQTYKG